MIGKVVRIQTDRPNYKGKSQWENCLIGDLRLRRHNVTFSPNISSLWTTLSGRALKPLSARSERRQLCSSNSKGSSDIFILVLFVLFCLV